MTWVFCTRNEALSTIILNGSTGGKEKYHWNVRPVLRHPVKRRQAYGTLAR